MKPKYFQVSLGRNIELPIGDRSSRGGLKAPCNLLK